MKLEWLDIIILWCLIVAVCIFGIGVLYGCAVFLIAYTMCRILGFWAVGNKDEDS